MEKTTDQPTQDREYMTPVDQGYVDGALRDLKREIFRLSRMRDVMASLADETRMLGESNAAMREVMYERFGNMAGQPIIPEEFGFEEIAQTEDTGVRTYGLGNLRLRAPIGDSPWTMFHVSYPCDLKLVDAMDLAFGARLMGERVDSLDVANRTIGSADIEDVGSMALSPSNG